MADPVRAAAYREDHRFREERYRREKGVPERKWSAKCKRTLRDRDARRRVDPVPFLGWLDGWLASNQVSEEILAERAGSATRSLFAIRSGEVTAINLDFVDRYLLAANESPCVLDELYPIDACVA
jgi:hypothetical protein